MGKELVLGKETPVNIGDYVDKDSLASKLLNKIDRVKNRAFFLSKYCSCASKVEECFYENDLDEMETLLCEMGSELVEAHEIICSPKACQKKAPVTEPSHKDSSGA